MSLHSEVVASPPGDISPAAGIISPGRPAYAQRSDLVHGGISHHADSALDLYGANTLDAIWRLLVEPCISRTEWMHAAQTAATILPQLITATNGDMDRIIAAVLAEATFGPNRWQLRPLRRLYYRMKAVLPHDLRIVLRRRFRRRQEKGFPLGWPIEDRYARFLFRCMAHVARQRGLDSIAHIGFWPHGSNSALVLTHDVEDRGGLAFVRTLADLEEALGFRSVFNFVPERYAVEPSLLASSGAGA